MPTDLAEQIITAAMTGQLDPDDAERLIEIHTRVCRVIFCPITGRVLDSRTAHLLTLTTTTGLTANVAINPDISSEQLERRLDDAGLLLVERFDPTTAWATIR
jgi:hypothetical protein